MTNPVTEKLLALAVEQTRMGREEVLAAIDEPDWDNHARNMYEWTNYTPSDVQSMWADLSNEAKLSILVCSLAAASAALQTDRLDDHQ